jgi:protein-tyrosine phosphatase
MKNPIDKTRILFVCLGNICRSPAAETIFKAIATKHRLNVVVDSAGTSAWHEGELTDHRMRESMQRYGYKATSLSRPFRPEKDFDAFDMIIAMDELNYIDIRQLARNETDEKKIFKMKDFFINQAAEFIPDPYYSGPSGFDLVITLLEDASQGLVNHLKEKMPNNI